MEIKVLNIIMLTNLHLHVKTWRKKGFRSIQQLGEKYVLNKNLYT